VVRYLDVFPREESVQGIISVVTVMEHCSRGDLCDYLTNVRDRQRHGLAQSVVMAWCRPTPARRPRACAAQAHYLPACWCAPPLASGGDGRA
jgi:hypothetical protein